MSSNYVKSYEFVDARKGSTDVPISRVTSPFGQFEGLDPHYRSDELPFEPGFDPAAEVGSKNASIANVTIHEISAENLQPLDPGFISPASTLQGSQKYEVLAIEPTGPVLGTPAVGEGIDQELPHDVFDPLFDRNDGSQQTIFHASTAQAKMAQEGTVLEESTAQQAALISADLETNCPKTKPGRNVESGFGSLELMDSLIGSNHSPYSFSMLIPSHSERLSPPDPTVLPTTKASQTISIENAPSNQLQIQNDLFLGDPLQNIEMMPAVKPSSMTAAPSKKVGGSKPTKRIAKQEKKYSICNPNLTLPTLNHGKASEGRQCKAAASKRKPRTYSRAVPSQHCHICSRRPTEESPHAACGNLNKGKCRKTICRKCFVQYGWDIESAKNAEVTGWVCPHCQGSCPERAQCHIYDRTSERRRNKTVNHRKPKSPRTNLPRTGINGSTSDRPGILNARPGILNAGSNLIYPPFPQQNPNFVPQPRIFPQAAFEAATGSTSCFPMRPMQPLEGYSASSKTVLGKLSTSGVKQTKRVAGGATMSKTKRSSTPSVLTTTKLSAQANIAPPQPSTRTITNLSGKKGTASAPRKRVPPSKKVGKMAPVPHSKLSVQPIQPQYADANVVGPQPSETHNDMCNFITDNDIVPLDLNEAFPLKLDSTAKLEDVQDFGDLGAYEPPEGQDIFQFSLEEALDGHATHM